jgi:hypothetical protein
MSNLSMFESAGPPLPEKRTAKQDRAINSFLQKGYRLLMRNGPGYNFENKSTGQVVNHTIDELLDWYNEEQKEARRAAAAEKKRTTAKKRRYA